jgi:hypothetical protein
MHLEQRWIGPVVANAATRLHRCVCLSYWDSIRLFALSLVISVALFGAVGAAIWWLIK